MTYLITILAIVGVVFNIRKSPISYQIWCVTNLYWLLHNIKITEYAQAILYAVFFGLSIYGTIEWQRQKQKSPRGN